MDLVQETGLGGKPNFNGCTGPGAKELDRRLPHYFSAAGVPANADKCQEAVQSNLTGHSAHFLIGIWEMLHCKL